MSLELYPDLLFHLQLTPFESYQLYSQGGYKNGKRNEIALHTDDLDKELSDWKKSLPLDQLQVLYVYGIGLGYYYLALKSWLQEKRERVVVFLEDDLGALSACLQMDHADQLLKDPQVFVRYIPGPKSWDPILEECAQQFPFDRLEVTGLCTYRQKKQSKLKNIRLKLLRKTVPWHAFLSETLHASLFYKNILANIQRLPGSFHIGQWKDRFAGLPAFICGAGPSLNAAAPVLKQIQNTGLILAGGSAITSLSHLGVKAHLGVAIDPNPTEFVHLSRATSFDLPMLYGNRVNPDIFQLFKGPRGYIRTASGGPLESWCEKQLNIEGQLIGPELGKEAMSVTTLAIALAHFFGCNPIVLVGVDLAYTGGKRYASGVQSGKFELQKETRASERLLLRKDRQGNRITTAVKWIMESEALSRFAKNHPDRQYINATDGGIGFRSIPYQPLQQVVDGHRTGSFDLNAILEQTPLTQITSTQIQQLWQELDSSLARCDTLHQQMIEQVQKTRQLDTTELLLLQMDLQDEVAYGALLENQAIALDWTMGRLFHLPHDRFSPDYQNKQIELALAKLQQTQKTISIHQGNLQSVLAQLIS